MISVIMITISRHLPFQAFDTASGQIQASLISIDSQPLVNGIRPNTLTEGTHTLVYEAEDDSDNKASMTVVIDVTGNRVFCIMQLF